MYGDRIAPRCGNPHRVAGAGRDLRAWRGRDQPLRLPPPVRLERRVGLDPVPVAGDAVCCVSVAAHRAYAPNRHRQPRVAEMARIAAAIPVGCAIMLLSSMLRLLRCRLMPVLAVLAVLASVTLVLYFATPVLKAIGNWNLAFFFLALLAAGVLM